MIELMHEAEGVGLAAPQVSLPWRMFVTAGFAEVDDEDGEVDPQRHPDRVFINPSLELKPGPLQAMEEGCLSLPDIRCEIRRPGGATITAQNLDGETISMASEGFISRVWQHDFDHLEGVLIIDRMTPIDRIATRRTLKDLEAAAQ